MTLYVLRQYEVSYGGSRLGSPTPRKLAHVMPLCLRHEEWERNPPINPAIAPHLPVPNLFFFLSLRDRTSRRFGNGLVLQGRVLNPDDG